MEILVNEIDRLRTWSIIPIQAVHLTCSEYKATQFLPFKYDAQVEWESGAFQYSSSSWKLTTMLKMMLWKSERLYTLAL